MAGEEEVEEQIHYNSTNVSSDWPFSNNNNVNPSDVTNASSNTMWEHHHHQTNAAQSLGAFGDMNNMQNNATTTSSSSLGFRKGNLLGHPRNLDMWAQTNLGNKRGGGIGIGMFMPPGGGGSAMLPHTLSQFPADSGFIERAARLSSFSGGNFEDIINPFGSGHDTSLSPYSGRSQVQAQEGFVGNAFKSASGEGSKDLPLQVDGGINDGSQSQPKPGGSGFSGNNLAGETEFSGDGGQGENSNSGHGPKKRRRNDQDSEYNQVKRSPQTPGEATKNTNEVQQKGDNNNTPNSVANKSSGKHGKQISQSLDAPKEEYIHVRARRGQATNSHSLAERVRREKISERMKFLQDLVPGCSKVTGKAVMLDEIINYVQSLQRQVEFLSMKLATVNPRMDFNLEGLLAKDMLESRLGSSGALGFGADMAMPYPPNQSQMAIMQGGISGVGSSSDAVRRTLNSHLMTIGGGFKDPASQVPSSWDDELHNIVQMGLNPSTPISSQNLGSTPPGHLKAEP